MTEDNVEVPGGQIEPGPVTNRDVVSARGAAIEGRGTQPRVVGTSGLEQDSVADGRAIGPTRVVGQGRGAKGRVGCARRILPKGMVAEGGVFGSIWGCNQGAQGAAACRRVASRIRIDLGDKIRPSGRVTACRGEHLAQRTGAGTGEATGGVGVDNTARSGRRGRARAAAADGQGPRHIAGQVDGRTAAGGGEATLRVHGEAGAAVGPGCDGRVGQGDRPRRGHRATGQARTRGHAGDAAAAASRNGLRAQLAIILDDHHLMRRVPGSGCDAPDALDGGRRGRSIADQRRAAAQARGVGAEDDLVARRAGRGVGRVTDIDVVVPGRGHQAAAVAQGHVALARGVLEERPVAHGHVAHPVRGQVAVRRVRRVRADQGRGPDGDVLAVVEVPRPIVVAQVPQGVAAHRHVLPGLGVRRERAVARGQVVSGRRRAAVRVGAHGHVVVVVRGDPGPGPGRRAAHHGEHLHRPGIPLDTHLGTIP